MFVKNNYTSSWYSKPKESISQNLNGSILNHLFLPHNLPSSSDTDYLIDSDHRYEYKLLEYVNEYWQSFDAKNELSVFQVLKKCFQYWAAIQNKENCSVPNLQSIIQKLVPGDFLPLYFHAQNAAILIEIDENHTDQPLISSWQVALPPDVITSSLEPHFSDFPVPVFRLPNRSHLLSRVHCELLIDFMNNTIEHAKVQKSSYRFDEIRDVPTSHYVCQWWITQFQDAQVHNQTNPSIAFKKKHRDQIRHTRSMLPFRRSGLWMTIKVVLHTILVRRLGNIGTIVYKLLITHFLTYCISEKLSNNYRISNDILMHCLRKIVRRLNKIDQLLPPVDSNDIDQWIQNVKEEIKQKVDVITPSPKWQKSIEKQKKQKHAKLHLHPYQQETYQHPCRKLKEYIDQRRSGESSRYYFDGFGYRCLESNRVADRDDDLPRSLLTNRDEDPMGIVLTRAEIWIQYNLAAWIDSSLQSDKGNQTFEKLQNFYENYQNAVLKWYYSENKSTDPIGYSRFILTSLTIIRLMHKNLCEHGRFQRLKLHAIRIPNLLELFEYLVLPNRNEMFQARTLYDYFQEFSKKTYPDLLSNIESRNSFGVQFADQSPEMNETLEKIQEQIEQDKKDKTEEVNKAKKKYEELMKKVIGLKCECESDVNIYYKKCDRCNFERAANNIKVDIYECPIPSERESALAVIFELQMPNEIRCYRDILWLFANRPNPKPSHKMYEWLSSRPHGSKLAMFYRGPRDCKVQLLSAKRSLSETHYSAPRSIASTPLKEFFYENSLQVQITPTRPTTLQDECRTLTPELSDPNYKSLQFSIESTQFVQNKTIANLSKCTLQLKPIEFLEFGSFRSGHRLQWWNLLSALETDSLSMDEESVAVLITHALLQNGPFATDGKALIYSWCPESHQQLLEDHFVDELIVRLERHLKHFECNWQNELVLIIITVVVIRIFTICNSTRKQRMTDVVLKCRNTGAKWIQLILKSIHNPSSADSNKMDELRDKIGIIGIACLLTFSVYTDASHSLDLSNDDVMSLLNMITTVHDNLILGNKQLNMSVFMRNLMRQSERVLVSIHPMVKKLLEKNSYELLNEFASIYWAVIRTKGKADGKWKKRSENIYDGWYDGQYESNKVSINCFNGQFVVNDQSVRFLPNNITSDKLFQRVFGNHIFEVQRAEQDDTYITKNGYHHDGKVHYEFNRQNYCLRIYERHAHTNDRFELIPPKCFEDEVAEIFVSNYSHWWNDKTKIVEFRPVHFQHENFLHDIHYILAIKKGFIRTNNTENRQYLINRSSSFLKNLFTKYFIRLDSEPYVYMLADNGIINIHLSRLGIAFKYSPQHNTITSREYSDMHVDENQCFGTLTGLRSGLLLSPMAATEHKNRHQLCRKLIVPYGEIRISKKPDRHHQTVTIDRTSEYKSPFLHQYFVFILNDRLRILQPTDSPTGWLYLALLHAVTSHCLPDQYTGMTGMERSFELLNSAGSWCGQPFDPVCRQILLQIAIISPQVNYYPENNQSMEKIEWNPDYLPYSLQHFGYYLVAKKLLEASEEWNFMYSTSATHNNDELEKLFKTRLSPQMEAEIQRTSAVSSYKSLWENSMIPFHTKVSVSPQRFGFESFRNHYQIHLKLADTSIDQKLLESARLKFMHPHSGYFIKPTACVRIMNEKKEFPKEIFPSTDSQVNLISDIAKYFKEHLAESWNQFKMLEEYRKEYPSSNIIERFLRSLRQESRQTWSELGKSIIFTNQLLFKTGLTVRFLPTELLSVFHQTWLNETEINSRNAPVLVLTPEQRILLGGMMVNWVVEQQIERALHFGYQKKWEDFESEISNVPHTNWVPSQNLPWLIMELEMNITIREIQVEVARHMTQPIMNDNDPNMRNTVMQLNMGEGKTSVIVPMLALCLCSSSSSLVRIIVLKSLFPTNYQSLRHKLGGLLNRRVLSFACRRDMNFNESQANQIFNRLQYGLSQRDVVLTSPEDILSFDLLTIDKCRRNEFDVGRSMLSTQCWIKTYVRDILDESDEILHVKYQLIYSIGGQKQVDGGLERWRTIQTVLNLVKQHATSIATEFNDDVSYKVSERKSSFPEFRLLNHQPFPELCKRIAKDWLNQKSFRQSDEQLILQFILDTSVPITCLKDRFPYNIIQLFLVMRGLLSSEVLCVTLKKRYRVNFGVNPNPKFNRLMAVPFRAKDVAAENTEFGHPDVALVLTQISYYYSGLSDLQLRQCFDRLSQNENDPKVIYNEWISLEEDNDTIARIKQWKQVNLKDKHQRTEQLFPTFRRNIQVINYFLNNFVYPHESKQFPHKLIASPWDLSSSVRKKIMTGFSGTNDTQLLLPVHIHQCDLPELKKTDAVVLNNLLQPKNEHYQDLPISASSEEILKQIVNTEPMIQVILDVGALFIDGSNRQIAIKWLDLSNINRIDYVVYFEMDSIFVCDRQYQHHAFSTSPASERLDRCLFYLDEIHTRGTDFKFPNEFRAAVTLGNGLTKDRLVQACMRMRKLGKHHWLSFWSSSEVHHQIQTLKKTSALNKEKENINDHISLTDILRWVYENTQQATWDGLHHWATQSLSFQQKISAFRNIDWNNYQQILTNIMMENLAKASLDAEILDLKTMYGHEKTFQTVYEIYSTRYQYSNTGYSTEIHEAVSKRLLDYGGSKKLLTQLLDEEQQRELEREQETEEERQQVRPIAAVPCEPILHHEVMNLCETQGPMLNLSHLPNVFCSIADAFIGTTFYRESQPGCWQENLWVTTEFKRVIQTKGESLDPFLRPPRWVLIYRNQHIIFLSPYEANELMDRLQYLYHKSPSDKLMQTTLRLLLPRTRRDQSILFNTRTLTIPPLISSDPEIPDYSIPIEVLVALFAFNGTIYFENKREQDAYCKFLGLCLKPRNEIEINAFDNGWINIDGFVENLDHRQQLQLHQCRFSFNPLIFIRKLIENRNQAHAPLSSHVGSIIINAIKLPIE
ncbi:unnamed protein product [Rotaria sp. Silwood2]|nr:unnamed protein product [Rotaria sp. Silwood2]